MRAFSHVVWGVGGGAGLRDLPVWGLEVVAGIEGKANVGRGAARRLGRPRGSEPVFDPRDHRPA